MHVFVEKNPIEKLCKFVFPHKVTHFDEITQVLNAVRKLEKSTTDQENLAVMKNLCNDLLEKILSPNENMVCFIREQLNLATLSKNNYRYSPELLVLASLLHTISPHAYVFLRKSGSFILPHPTTIRKLCNELQLSPPLETTEHFLKYIGSRVRFVKDVEKTVAVLLDEIHINPYFEYKGGSIIGASCNSSSAATSAYVFMISSLFSEFKEVVHIMPVTSVNGEMLYKVIRDVVTGLEDLGLKVVCIITDNNAINGRAISFFANPPIRSFVYKHPISDSHGDTRPLFHLIDSVHLLKCMRNNWLNQKNPETCMYYPNFGNGGTSEEYGTASFKSLRKLHEIEQNELVTYTNRLTLKSLSPSNLERQNVKLALKVFDRFVVQALLELGEKNNIQHYSGTATFIQIICTWWDVMNVQTPVKGIHQRNDFMTPLNMNEDDKKNKFLNDFLNWLEAWKKMKCSTGAFSKSTHEALVQTTYGILELCRYCVEECHMQYILTGKIQTDPLEDRFGKYRQLAGSHYNISLTQLLEAEKKLRFQSSVRMELMFQTTAVEVRCVEYPDNFEPLSDTHDISAFFPVTVEDCDVEDAKEYLPVLTYLAGYCCYSVLKRLKCSDCRESLTLEKTVDLDQRHTLIRNLDRGGLKCPTPAVADVVLYNYIITNKLHVQENFFSIKNQRQVLTDLTIQMLELHEMQVVEDICRKGHTNEQILKLIISVSTNIMLKNLCRMKNDSTIVQQKKRKMQIFNR